ncbi:MAG: NAD(P)-binding domain-containing protein [Terracidiphilus sp.]
MSQRSTDCQVVILGAGPYGLSAATYLRAAGVEARVFGKPMSFWHDQMPKGMCLRSNWGASHIADPRGELTLDAYCREIGNHVARPIPLDRFVDYGQWFQRKGVPNVDGREIRTVECLDNGFRIALSDGEALTAKRVVIAAGIQPFATRPSEFDGIPPSLASHSSQHSDLSKFSGKFVIVIGAGQSALESAALLMGSGAKVEVLCRCDALRWVGVHPRLHHLGPLSKMLYSNRDVGPAGISRLVAAPHLFRRLPRRLQNRTAYRAIRPAVAGWLKPRIADVAVSYRRRVTVADVSGDRLRLKLSDGTERLADHVLLATGYRVDIGRYSFLTPALVNKLITSNGFPVLKRGLESSIPGLHILGKPAAWSFGPIVGFVSGTEFASSELVRSICSADARKR